MLHRLLCILPYLNPPVSNEASVFLTYLTVVFQFLHCSQLLYTWNYKTNHSELSLSKVKFVSFRSATFSFDPLSLNCYVELHVRKKLTCNVNGCNIHFRCPPVESFLVNLILKSRLSNVTRHKVIGLSSSITFLTFAQKLPCFLIWMILLVTPNEC